MTYLGNTDVQQKYAETKGKLQKTAQMRGR